MEIEPGPWLKLKEVTKRKEIKSLTHPFAVCLVSWAPSSPSPLALKIAF